MEKLHKLPTQAWCESMYTFLPNFIESHKKTDLIDELEVIKIINYMMYMNKNKIWCSWVWCVFLLPKWYWGKGKGEIGGQIS